MGVGTGRVAAPRGRSGGLDPSLPMMAVARDRGVPCIRGVAEQLPFRDGAFDILLMVTVDFLLRDKPGAFREAGRVLDPSGSIVVGFIRRDSPLARRYETEKGRDEGDKRRGGGMKEKKGEKEGRKGMKGKDQAGFYRDARFLSPEEMTALLEGAGFRDLVFAQTLFSQPEEMTSLQLPIPGYGRGSFVVVRGERL